MKNQKGAVAIYVIVVCLVVLLIGFISYMSAYDRQGKQLATLNKIDTQHNDTSLKEQDTNSENSETDIVPIYTPQQFSEIGTGAEVYVEQTGQMYIFSTDKTYMFYGTQEEYNTLFSSMKEDLKNKVKIELVREIVTTTAESVSVLEGIDNNLEKYFRYTENADDKVKSVVYTDTCHNNAIITNTKTLDAGTHTIKCTVTKESGIASSAIKKITVESSGIAKENTVIKPDANSNLQIVIPAGFGIAILESGTTTSGVTQSGKVASIMPKEQWGSITTEQINKGIVVVDNAITYDGGGKTGAVPDFNEYVWVPIPESSDFARTAWVGPYNNNGTWTSGTHPLSTTSESTKFWEDQTKIEYKNMISSVNTNKGFYIGRYEASVEKENMAQSKRGQKPRRSVSQVNAIIYSANNPTLNTHLIYGIEWDSVLNWLIGNAQIESSTIWTTKTMELKDVAKDSRTWGNYSTSTGNAARGIGEVKETGWNEYWKANNIYDLAGNVWELTQERYSIENECTRRGGDSIYEGEGGPVAFRRNTNINTQARDLRFPLFFLFIIYNAHVVIILPNGRELCKKSNKKI